jgi:Prp8 binding protein
MQVYAGGIEQDVLVYDLRKGAEAMRLAGHRDTVTGLSVCPGGDHLLTNSMDGTLRMWDMRPYAPANR